MDRQELQQLSEQLGNLCDREFRVTQIFGEYLSLSADGIIILKCRSGELYFNMNCDCGRADCEIGRVSKSGLSGYKELSLNTAGKGFFEFGGLKDADVKRLAIDIIACGHSNMKITKQQMLVMKGSINRRLATRLGRLGILSVDDLRNRTIAVAYHDLRDAYPEDTNDKHLFCMYARVLNKNVMFLTKSEKNDIKFSANRELARRVKQKIETSHGVM
ncbi:hypothetical protein ACP3V3_02545 [Vibrio sp. PNB22_3_1]